MCPMGSAFGSLLLTGSKRKRDGDACACVDGTRNTQQNYQQVREHSVLHVHIYRAWHSSDEDCYGIYDSKKKTPNPLYGTA